MFEGNVGDHKHRLSPVDRRNGLECAACDRPYRRGYFCGECKFKVHDKCTFLFKKEMILEHPSHAGHRHRLEFLTTGAPDHTDPNCHICGKNTSCLVFHCSTCKQNLDIDCMIDAMCARANLSMPWHHHPLLIVDISGLMPCDVCGRNSKSAYFCPRCRLVVHEECVVVFDSPEITHPSHVRHPLKLLTRVPDYADSECHVCGEYIENLLYHCDICKFNLHIDCSKRTRPPLSFSNLKVHEHTLKLMPRLLSFVCDACGTEGDRAPYTCLQCDFMIHQDCSRLPRVIHVNRHDHRVAYTYPLGPGQWTCGVCWEEIDWSCGAYSCSRCPNFAVHSRCAIRKDVWDEKELDEVPEEDEDLEPFKVNDDNTITHFAHEHNLSLEKDGISLDKSILCGACVRSLGSDTFYKCSECDFILHEVCASLPKIKRHFLSAERLILQHDESGFQLCKACSQCCFRGFFYIDSSWTFDLPCSSITEPLIHECHPHPLFFIKGDRYDLVMIKTCQGCGINIDYGVDFLGCIKCNFFLDFRCATLPLTTRLQRYDDHPLVLSYGERGSHKYWCDICERQTNPETWFYTCEDCGVTLHILCVLWDLRYAKAGEKLEAGLEDEVEVQHNNTSTRPLCNNCHTRCPGSYFLKACKRRNVFFCSYYCSQRDEYNYNYNWINYGLCPPWAYKPNS